MHEVSVHTYGLWFVSVIVLADTGQPPTSLWVPADSSCHLKIHQTIVTPVYCLDPILYFSGRDGKRYSRGEQVHKIRSRVRHTCSPNERESSNLYRCCVLLKNKNPHSNPFKCVRSCGRIRKLSQSMSCSRMLASARRICIESDEVIAKLRALPDRIDGWGPRRFVW